MQTKTCIVVHTVAVVSWYSPKISHNDHLDSTIADAPLQALGLDRSLYGYNEQMKYPLLPSWCPSRTTGPYNFVESTMHQGKGYIQPYIPIHSKTEVCISYLGYAPCKSRGMNFTVHQVQVRSHDFILSDKIISLKNKVL